MAKKGQGRKSGGRKLDTVGGKRPLLTAALMVKNEEEMLPRCLKSVRRLVDEIVVVDTGSTDRTVAIAEGFGARVYHHPWQDNFSLHRNQSIGYVKGEWFLIIDADEELQLNAGMTPERFYENLRTALKKAPEVVNVMLLGVKNVNRDGSIASSSQSARLFRAGTGVHYEGIVHNKAVYTGKVMPLNATILHYGYDLPPDAMARKYQRTASLLHRRLEDNPDDIEAHFYLCQVYMHMGDAEKAMPYGRRCLEMVAHLDEGMDKSFYWTLYHSLAVCCLVAGRHDEARLWVARGLERLPHDVDLHYDLVQLALIAKDFPGLAAAAEKHIALACRYRQAPQAYGTRFIYTAGPDYEQQVRYWLLTARVALGELERAREQWPMVLPYLLKKPDKVTEYLGNLVCNDGGDLTAEHAAALARGFMEAGDVVRAAECCRFGLDAGVRQPEFLVTVLFLGRMMGNDALEADAATAYLEGLSSYDEMPSPVAAIMIDFLLSQGHERHAVDIMGVLFSRYGLSLPAADEPGMMKAIAAGCERLAAEFAADSPLAAATCKQLATRIAGGLGYAPTGAEKIAENITSQVDKLNTLDMVCHHEKNDDKALESLQQTLLIEPGHDDALYNNAILLFEKGDFFKSWRYLTRIKNKTWNVYNTLGDTQLQLDNPIMALHYYKKASALSKLDEIKDKYDHIKNNYKKSIKLAIFCLPGLDSFIKDIANILSNLYDLKLLVTTDSQQIRDTYDWADIVWIEWANELAIEITNKLPKNGKKVICRLHSYESLSNYPERINWKTVDRLILVAEHIRDVLQIYHPQAYKQIKDKISIIPNGLDLTKFVFKTRQPGYDLAVVAHINHKKDPASWLQVIAKLKTIDKRYKLHIAGDFQDLRYANYFRHFIKETHLEKNIELLGFVNDVNGFLEDKNYLLSTSIHESFGYNIAEAMARGIKPIIHNFDGAKTIWPNEFIYNAINEAVEKVSEQTYDSESYRRFIEDNYPLEQQIKTLETTLNALKKIDKKTSKKVTEDQNVLFLDNMISKFMEFTPYTDKYIDSFDFEDSKIRIGKVEKITDEVSLIEFIVKNKLGQQLALQNIWYNHSTKQITLADYISLSKNKMIIQSFVHHILDSRISYIGNMGGFINDEEILEDIKNNQLVYNWERGIPATQFMPAFGYLKTMLRYSFVSQFIKGSYVVLDAACGFGYGSAYFSKFCNKVYALDLAEDNIKFGENTYSFKNINWMIGDVTALPFENDKFDIYVSFETFEHLPLQVIHNYIEEAIRVVKKDSLFILSTPNSETRKNIHNPFHIKEYNFHELNSVLQQYFKNTKFFSQVNFTIVEGYNERASNFIAVCINNKFKTND